MEAAAHLQDRAKRTIGSASDRTRRRRELVHDVLEEEEEEELQEDYEIVWFCRSWETFYAHYYGSFEDTTTVPPMRCTFGSIPEDAMPDSPMQIFGIKVDQIKDDLHWPLHVYGLVVARDSIDPRRNLLFHRTRDDCQILTQEDPNLLLTGPSRAIVLIDPVSLEIQLKAKGETESEDKLLHFNVFISNYACSYSKSPHIDNLDKNRSNLEFTFAVLDESVEATIRVEVVDGSWPDDFHGLVVARTASMAGQPIVLLDSRVGKMPISGSGGKMPISGCGLIELSRRVVSVELSGKLMVDVYAVRVDNYGKSFIVSKRTVVFAPKEASISHDKCDLGFCKLGITISWSLLAPLKLQELPGRSVSL